MLKPIHKVDCSPALAACQKLMQTFALWLCDPGTASVDQAALRSAMPSPIEADWLWDLLRQKEDDKPLLDRAKPLVDLSDADKMLLTQWIEVVGDLPAQFGNPTNPWPVNNLILPGHAWLSFKSLMQCFYSKGLQKGLPYQADGTPVAQGGVTYAEFVKAFRVGHRQSDTANAREVCVLCGGRLGATPEVDHWVGKSPYPLLSVCADNLLPICGDCNSTSNKGTKAVHSNGLFDGWFHPYHRPGAGRLRPTLVQKPLGLQCRAIQPSDQQRVENLDHLLHLSQRWTRELKEEHAKHLDSLRREERKRLNAGLSRQSLDEVRAYIDDWRAKLLDFQPDYEVHSALGDALADPARQEAFHADLSDVQ